MLNMQINAITNVKDLRIDFIEVKLNNDDILTLDWSESEYNVTDRDDDLYNIEYKYRNVFNHLTEEDINTNYISDIKITNMGLYSDLNDDTDIKVTDILFYDECGIVVPNTTYRDDETGYLYEGH